jgi:hypothetical protein
MLRTALAELIFKELGHSPTQSQGPLIKNCRIHHGTKAGVAFIIKGFAGTGKTTVLGAMFRTMDSLSHKSFSLHQQEGSKVFSVIQERMPAPFTEKFILKNQLKTLSAILCFPPTCIEHIFLVARPQ